MTLGALIKLSSAIDFDAADRQPVDLLFALLVPEESTEEHLEVLAELARMFSDESLREKLREASSPDAIYELLMDWKQTH